MKRVLGSFLILIALLGATHAHAQKNNLFERFKAMKLSFILENTNLSPQEIDSFKSIFDAFENQYHDEVWILKRKVWKEAHRPFDTMSPEDASNFINDEYRLEQLGMTIKHKRNQELLKVVCPENVLEILIQEKEFDQVILKRMRNQNKEERNKKKDRE